MSYLLSRQIVDEKEKKQPNGLFVSIVIAVVVINFPQDDDSDLRIGLVPGKKITQSCEACAGSQIVYV